MPVCFDLPQKYDGDGQPFHEEVRESWRDRQKYVETAGLAELKDSVLSACLGSNRSQTISYSYVAYTDIGKLGFYDQVMKELESEE
jgi:hypothetical protein